MVVMRKRLILHVGIHKTGTTSIQTFLSENAEKLKSYGYYVPVNHFDFENKATQFRNYLYLGDKSSYTPIIDDIFRQSELNNCHTIVLSDEDFQHFVNDKNDNLRVLEQYFDIEIIIYIRRQDTFAESVYGFSVQWYTTRFKEDFYTWVEKFPVKNYKWDLQEWENKFYLPELKVRVYDEVILFQDVLTDFIDAIGLRIDDDWKYPKRENTTLNKYIINFLRRTNHIDFSQSEFEEIKKFLATKSSIKDGPKAIYLNKEERYKILNHSVMSNKYVAKKYFNRNELFPRVNIVSVPQDLTDDMYQRVLHELKLSSECGDIIQGKLI